MKKWKLKTRLQVGFFRAALTGTAIALLLAPSAGKVFDEEQRERLLNQPVVSAIAGWLFGPGVKVMINGDVVALAPDESAARAAWRQARLAYNADGIKALDADVSFEAVDTETDHDALQGMYVQRGDRLYETIYDCLDRYADADHTLAYTMRVDDSTLTIDSLSDLVSVLERIQGAYDTEDAFQVGLKQPASHNVTMYEVVVTSKAEDAQSAEAGSEAEQSTEAGSETEQSTEPGSEAEQSTEDANLESQAAEDGVKYVGFADDIQVTETYVNAAQVTDPDTAYTELTTKNAESDIYVVEPGDALSVIAEKNQLTVDEIKALNPQIESDDDIYYDDRLNITVPRATVQVLVEKQETYREDYNADVVYEDDADMYIGETEVVQEGSSGSHVVTDLVTYRDDAEYGREQLKETVEVAAVAEIVKRGTKSKPTYMYPVTNWNVTSNFGYRWGRLHAGTDVGVPVGTTVRASRAGQVVTAGWVGGYGNCVIIDHGDGICTRYGHLSEVTVSVGQYVEQGEQVALSGNTGRSTGPHLHFEIRVNGEAVDPLPYLAGTE